MTQMKTAPGMGPQAPNSMDYDSSNSAKVIPLRPNLNPAAGPFDALTARLVMDRARAGTLDPAVVGALLAAVGLHP